MTNNFAAWVKQQSDSGQDKDFILSHDLRSTSLSILNDSSYPTRKDEEWRYTPLNDLFAQTPIQAQLNFISPSGVAELKSAVPGAHHLVFVDGQFSQDLSTEIQSLSANGVSVKLIADLGSPEQSRMEHAISNSRFSDDNIFQHISLGLSRVGLFIEVEDNSEANSMLHLIYITTTENGHAFTNPVNVISLGSHSRLKVVEQFTSVKNAQDIAIPASYFVIGEGSGLEHYKIGDQSKTSKHICNTSVQVGTNAEFRSHQYLLGSELTRSNMEVSFAGPGGHAVLRGIYLGDDKQHLDIRTYMDHAHPHCSSDQQFRGILDGESRGVFNGMVLVREDAQKTDAQQSNKNLLLSRKARIDAKPQLEIYADDVKCAHGATVGELDEDALFYLQSRGIGKKDAILMLTRAFAAEITQGIEIESLRKYAQEKISNSLSNVSTVNV